MPKARPDSATTYKEHFQNWNVAPKLQKDRPKTSPGNGLQVFEDLKCPNAIYWSQIESSNDCRQISVKRSKKCLHLHVHNIYQVNLENLPADKVEDIVNSCINGRTKAAVGKPSLVVKKSCAKIKNRGKNQAIEYKNGLQAPKKEQKVVQQPAGCKRATPQVSQQPAGCKIATPQVSCLCGGRPKSASPAVCFCQGRNDQKNPFTIISKFE